jgi:FtsZ-interacting cell division protein ZipA
VKFAQIAGLEVPMDKTTIIIVAVVLAVLVVAGFILMRRRRTEELQSRFGPEYERALKETGDKSKAETELQRREKRVEKLSIRPLDPAQRERFSGEWQRVQAEFVDNPENSVRDADILLQEVMRTRGYPVENFDQVAADVSVDHPTVVQHFRTAHDIARRHSKGEGNTEDLRNAMINYRALFDELVAVSPTTDKENTDRRITDDAGARERV